MITFLKIITIAFIFRQIVATEWYKAEGIKTVFKGKPWNCTLCFTLWFSAIPLLALGLSLWWIPVCAMIAEIIDRKALGI